MLVPGVPRDSQDLPSHRAGRFTVHRGRGGARGLSQRRPHIVRAGQSGPVGFGGRRLEARGCVRQTVGGIERLTRAVRTDVDAQQQHALHHHERRSQPDRHAGHPARVAVARERGAQARRRASVGVGRHTVPQGGGDFINLRRARRGRRASRRR